MFAVIFEVQPITTRRDEYLGLARSLKPKLDAVDGFLDIDRLASTRSDQRMLSLSTWRDEKAVVRWRTQADHHGVQERGRADIFADYRLRVGEVTEDSHPPQGIGVDQQRFDETAVGDAKRVTITEVTQAEGPIAAAPATAPFHLGLDPHMDGLVGVELFESLYHPGHFLLLASWRDAAAAARWTPTRPEAAQSFRLRGVRIIRDYGMFDRREAPQFFHDVTRTSDT